MLVRFILMYRLKELTKMEKRIRLLKNGFCSLKMKLITIRQKLSRLEGLLLVLVGQFVIRYLEELMFIKLYELAVLLIQLKKLRIQWLENCRKRLLHKWLHTDFLLTGIRLDLRQLTWMKFMMKAIRLKEWN